MQKRVCAQGRPPTLPKFALPGGGCVVVLSVGAAVTVGSSLAWM